MRTAAREVGTPGLRRTEAAGVSAHGPVTDPQEVRRRLEAALRPAEEGERTARHRARARRHPAHDAREPVPSGQPSQHSDRPSDGLSQHSDRPEEPESLPAASPDLAEALGPWPQVLGALDDRLTGVLGRARWSVPLPAITAVLVLGAVLAVALAVRSASGAPGVPVPVRPASGVPTASAATPTTTSPPATTATAARAGATGGPATGTGTAASPATSTAAPVVVVHVVGRVHRPGVVRLPAGSRVTDAVAAAGGATGEADLALLNLARVVADGEQVLVPAPGEQVPARDVAAAGGSPGGGAAGAGGAAVGAAGQPGATPTVVDLNTASVAELDALPGIGPVLAQRVVDFRTENGGFTSVEELTEVPGIGEVVLGRLRDLVRV